MSNNVIPSSIETDRLVLRTFVDGDWRALHDYYADEVCTRFTFGRALTEGESWRAMASMVGHWVLRGYGPYAVEEKASRSVLGIVGLWYPNDWPEPEIKWALCRRYWGNGFASEATRAVQVMASVRLPHISLISLIDSRNEASKRLATAVEAKFEKEMSFRNGIWHVYRHPRRSQADTPNEGAPLIPDTLRCR